MIMPYRKTTFKKPLGGIEMAVSDKKQKKNIEIRGKIGWVSMNVE